MGSGKSYGVMENVILPALEKGRTVYTNVPVKRDVLERDYQTQTLHVFGKDQAKEDGFWLSIPGGAVIVIVIDEAWRYWSSGTRASNIPEAEKEFFTEHRHRVGEGIGEGIMEGNYGHPSIILTTHAPFSKGIMDTHRLY